MQAFLDGRIRWVDIARVLEEALGLWPGDRADGTEAVLAADRRARRVAAGLVGERDAA